MRRCNIRFLVILFGLLALDARFVTAAPGQLYWAQAVDDQIARADGDGLNVEPLISFPQTNGILDLSLDSIHQKMYWAQSFDDRISRADFSGLDVEPVVQFPDASGLIAVAVDPVTEKVYWAQTFDDRIMRADPDGTNQHILFDFLEVLDVVDLEIDPIGRELYWAEAADGKIRRSDLDGANLQEVVGFPDASGIVAIAIDPQAGHVYWAQTFNNRIGRADLNGANPTVILQAATTIVNLAVDPNGSLYWAQFDDTIMRANLAGMGMQPILEFPDVEQPMAVVVETSLPGAGTIPAVSQWGLLVMALLMLTTGTIALARQKSSAGTRVALR